MRQLYDGLVGTFGDGTRCLGRVLLSVDGEDAATFLVKGLFPPGESSTHTTVFTVVNHGEREYTFMFHYPTDIGDAGFEWAVGLLQDIEWR